MKNIDNNRFLQKKIRPLSTKKRQKISSYGQPCVDTTVFKLNANDQKRNISKYNLEPV
jgi:hypothetical protein